MKSQPTAFATKRNEPPRNTVYLTSNHMGVSRSGVTLIELLLVVAFIAIGIKASYYFGIKHGTMGYVGGFLIGTAGSFLSFGCFGYCIGFLIGMITGFPEYPTCSNDTCQDREAPDSDYRYEDYNGALIARCKCGTPYIKRGCRVMQLQPNGETKPHMIWKPLRGWRRDETGN